MNPKALAAEAAAAVTRASPWSHCPMPEASNHDVPAGGASIAGPAPGNGAMTPFTYCLIFSRTAASGGSESRKASNEAKSNRGAAELACDFFSQAAQFGKACSAAT